MYADSLEIFRASKIRILLSGLVTKQNIGNNCAGSSPKNIHSKIHGIQHLNYWERLQKLYLFSLQRCREGYALIYVWKILENRVPNVNLQATTHPRKGRLCHVRTTPGSSHRIRSLTHHSFICSEV